jgi:hypothetical protein
VEDGLHGIRGDCGLFHGDLRRRNQPARRDVRDCRPAGTHAHAFNVFAVLWWRRRLWLRPKVEALYGRHRRAARSP